MPFQTNQNISPYFNDYDEAKNYHQILFRPATAVQARELSQLQTILQNQIERFGNWAFKNGDIVQGCNINDLPVVPFVFLTDSTTEQTNYDARNFVNCIAVSQQTNLQARVIFANVGFSANYPNCNIIYLNYINTGNNSTVGTGSPSFGLDESLSIYTVNNGIKTLFANVNTLGYLSLKDPSFYNANGTLAVNVSSNAHGISVSEGVIFINGAFVKVETPTFGLVNAFGTYASNNLVGFQAVESIITENQDSSLLDNALGYTNENAPGAHRLKITPTLITIDPENAANTVGFNPIATYNYGALVAKSTSANVYSAIGGALATRTYEESGNYVVNPFTVDTVTNSGDTSVSPTDSDHMFVKINPGVGYAQGTRVSFDKSVYVNMRRGIDTKVDRQKYITFNYGNYFQLKEVSGSFEFTRAQSVDLYDTAQQSITTRKFTSLSGVGGAPTGTKIGTAMARCFTYAGNGLAGTNTAIYYLHVFNVQMSNTSYSPNQVQSIYYKNGSIIGIGDIANPGLQLSTLKEQLFSFGVTGLKAIKDTSDPTNIPTQYTYRSSNTSTTLYPNGSITVSLTSSATGGSDELPYGGTFPFTLPAASQQNIIVTLAGSGASANLTANVDVSTTSSNVSGSGATSFATTFSVGDIIGVYSNSTTQDTRTITSIVNSSFLTVDSAFTNANTNAKYYKYYPAGKHLPLSQNVLGSSANVVVSNAYGFTINTSQSPTSSIPVVVTFDAERITASPASKTVNKNQFVKIDTRSNKNGPWCLGLSDVHKINAVYANTGNNYNTSSLNVTNYFNFDSGQRDTHYDFGYLCLKPGYSVSTTPYLLVQLDCFTTNTAGGAGFFSVESYPVDDSSTANTYTTIQTKDIPLYIDADNNKIPLRDYIDFRPVATPTANITGIVDTSNSTAVTTAIGYASYQPSNTITGFALSSISTLNVPSYGQNLQGTYEYYLPRKDIVYITPSNIIKTKEGTPSLKPKTPLYPDNAMVLAEINVPQYPSLTADQLNTLSPINRSSTSLCRDTSTSTSVNLLSNRRYTMKDIGNLDNRITNLEYYTQLSLLETKAKDMTVTDTNGLDRYKNGIFVEPFASFALSEVSNPEFSIAIDSQNSVARPRIVREVINLQFNSGTSSNVQKTGRVITLPYTEIPFISQPYATKYRSATHVAYAWNGTMQLFPSYNNHIDLNQNGAVNMTINTATPWQEFANSPFAYQWGDWRTTTKTAASSVVSGSVDTYTYTLNYGWQSTHDLPVPDLTHDQLYSILTYNGITPSSNFVIGSISNSYGGGQPGTVLSVPGTTFNNPNPPDNSFAVAVMIGWAMGWW